MATTTPNIGLTLPDGTENITRSIINGNNTLIDTAVGSLSDQMANLISNDLVGSYASRTALAESIWGGMSDNTINFGRAGVTGISNYLFLAMRTSSSNSVIILMSASNIIRMVTKLSGTVSEYSLTGS